MEGNEEAILDLILNNMTINLNMFGTLIKDSIISNMYKRLIVIMKVEELKVGIAKISEELFQPNELTSGDSHGTIFSFYRRADHYHLFLCTLENKTLINLNEIFGGGATGGRTARPI